MAGEMSPRSLAASSENASPRQLGPTQQDLDLVVPDVENDGDDEEEDEDESIDNIMMNMTVKSLHNLASYPNPNQKKAQKALLRPVKPRLPLGPQASNGNDKANVPYWQSALKFQQEYGHMPRNSLRHSYSDSATVAANPGYGLNRDLSQLDAYLATSRHPTTPSIIGDVADQSISWNGTHNAGAGPPRPLTAGPPGQRQYRPSTFESTFKALQTNSRRPVRGSEDDMFFMGDNFSQDHGHEMPPRLTSAYEGSEGGSYTQLFRDSEELKSSKSAGRSYGTVGFTDEAKGSPLQVTGQATANGATYWNRPKMPLLRSPNGSDKYSSELLGKSEYEAYMDKINNIWYGGCDKFCGSIIEADDEVGKQAVVGVIGDGRPGQRGGGSRHRQVTVEEANKTDASEHAKPLFNMAIASMEWTLSQHGLQAQ
jgi:hypothetical protein